MRLRGWAEEEAQNIPQDPTGPELVDALERIAKRFAEQAVRYALSFGDRGEDSHDDMLVNEAIARAEKGKP